MANPNPKAARDAKSVYRFFKKLEQRIEQENLLSKMPGLPPSAREAAARRASDFIDDLTYLRTRYERMSGQGNAR